MNVQIFQLLFYAVRMFWPTIKVSVDYPLAQAYHESQAFKSDLFLRANNLFGMKPATKRSTSASGTSGVYAAYLSPLDSIRDYFKRLDYYNIRTDADLLVDIKTRYATDLAYYRKVEAVRASLSPFLIPPAVVASITVGGTVAACYGAYRGINALSNA